ncbi:MAG: acylphosphatase [Fusobacteriota bacterium]
MKKFIIQGRVQMVGYRNFCLNLSKKLGLKGRVKNLSNGDVELKLNDINSETYDELLKNLKKGPPAANVTNIEVEEYSGQNYKDFQVAY